MMIHKTTVEKYNGTLTDLAEDLGNLRYDALVDFLQHLSAKIERDAAQDQAKGRPQLATALRGCSEKLSAASLDIATAWKICDPYL